MELEGAYTFPIKVFFHILTNRRNQVFPNVGFFPGEPPFVYFLPSSFNRSLLLYSNFIPKYLIRRRKYSSIAVESIPEPYPICLTYGSPVSIRQKRNCRISAILTQHLQQLFNFSVQSNRDTHDRVMPSISIGISPEFIWGASNTIHFIFGVVHDIYFCDPKLNSNVIGFNNLIDPLDEFVWGGLFLGTFFVCVFTRNQRRQNLQDFIKSCANFYSATFRMFIDQSPNVDSLEKTLFYLCIVLMSMAYKQYFTVSVMVSSPAEAIPDLAQLVQNGFKVIFYYPGRGPETM